MKGDPEGRSVLTGHVDEADERAYRSELFSYRYDTLALLEKYMAVSLDLGRLPSVLGGEMFRAKVTSYRVSSFEDLVIFVTDTAACLNRVSEVAMRFLALTVFQEFSKEEAAAKLGCEERNARRIYCDALDELSEVLLRFQMLDPMDWIGQQVAAEGWFEGCPVLRRNTWSAAQPLPPKKPSARVHSAGREKLLRMPERA